MDDSELQIETGNYTRIVNKIIEELVKQPLLGAEFGVCLFIIRKTYGFQKKDDQISLTQFEKGTNLSRPTIIKALKNLQLVNIVLLVEKGGSVRSSNSWGFNKYYKTWKPVNRTQLVKGRALTSKGVFKKLVKGSIHTKENNKRNTKETIESHSDSKNIVMVIDSFSGVNASFKKWYGHKTHRASISRLLEKHGLDRLLKVIELLPKTNELPYFPSINNPTQLEDKWSQLESAFKRKKLELTGKQKVFI